VARRYREYETLLGRCGGWSVDDLGDLLHEIDRDPELDDRERMELQSRLYRMIWDRGPPAHDCGSSPDR